MNRHIRIHLFILFPILMMCFSHLVAQETDTNFKVMTYNIWNGFDWGKDTIRQQNLIKWVRDKDPDVLALQELCGYNEEKLKVDAEKWGHQYVKILKTQGYPVGITSKKPITVKQLVIDSLWHGLLHCETYGIDFFVVHLSPFDCDFRLKEASIITDLVKNNKTDQFIILGDFNAHSAFDGESLKYNKRLLEKYSKKKPDSKYSNLRLGEFDYSVMSDFMSLPAIDIGAKFVDIKSRYTYPTPVLIGTWQTANEVEQNKERIDYILTSPIISKSCRKVTIYHDEDTDTFSDHYPVMAEFNFETK